MKTYIGTKTVKAEPMTEGEAHGKGFARENKEREGYHVEYTNPDGSTYDSWSPKDVFEKAYKPAETLLERLSIESMELMARTTKLFQALHSEGFAAKVGVEQYALMHEQAAGMKMYLGALAERIILLNKAEEK